MITEFVTENYSPEPGVMDTREYWIAYRDHVAGYGHMSDRISLASGVGDTEEVALADAERSITAADK